MAGQDPRGAGRDGCEARCGTGTRGLRGRERKRGPARRGRQRWLKRRTPARPGRRRWDVAQIAESLLRWGRGGQPGDMLERGCRPVLVGIWVYAVAALIRLRPPHLTQWNKQAPYSNPAPTDRSRRSGADRPWNR